MRIREQNIRVATVFEPGGRIRPVWFAWKREKHTVIETTYAWEGRRGAAKLLFFAVRDEGGIYELTYDTSDQTWSLEEVEAAP